MSSIIPEDLLCFHLATLEELRSQTSSKRYHFVDYSSKPQEADGSNYEEQVCIVPEQFPFVFQLAKRQYEKLFTPCELHAVFKQLNTMRRLQLARSTISLKIIDRNIKMQEGVSLGPGTLGITFLDPLTSSPLRATKHSFDLVEIGDHLSVANIDLEHHALMNPTAQVGISNKCNLVQFELKFDNFRKAQKCILFYGDFKKIRKSDLFYCFLNLRADINIKLYFVASSSTTNGTPVGYNLVKIQIVTSSLGLEKNCSPLKSSLRSSNKLNQNIQNYRFNIAPASLNTKLQMGTQLHGINFSQQSESLRTINFSGSQTEVNNDPNSSGNQNRNSNAGMREKWIEDSARPRGLQPSGPTIKGISKNPTQSGSDVRRVGGRMSVSPPEVESFQNSKGRDFQSALESVGKKHLARIIPQRKKTEKKTSGHYFMERGLQIGAAATGLQDPEAGEPGKGGKRIILLQEYSCLHE